MSKNGKLEKRKKKEEKKKRTRRTSQWCPCLCEGVAKAGDAFTETRLMPAFRVSTGLHVEHRRPSFHPILVNLFLTLSLISVLFAEK